ncbi:hypothetical protein AAHC03_019265 [Spirometra sp. Aus1]
MCTAMSLLESSFHSVYLSFISSCHAGADGTPRVAPTKSADLMLKLLKDVSTSKLVPSTSTSPATNGVDQPSGSSPAAKAELPILYTPNPGKKYACCVCENTLRRPVQFHVCGHNCCSKCFTDLMASSGRCPVDGQVLERSEVTVDKQMQRELDHLGVKCNYFEQGCTWTGLASELDEHLEDCQCRLVTCVYDCGVEFELRFLEQHLRSDCPRRPVVCQFCQEKIEMQEQPQHTETCKRFPIACPNGCKRSELPREELAEHLALHCPLQLNNCPFTEYGCTFRGKKKAIRDHLSEEMLLHMLLLRDALHEFRNLLDLQAVHESQATIKKLQTKLQRSEAYFEPSFIWRIEGYRQKFEEAQQGKRTALFSQPFYSHRHGYRVCLSICPYGEQRYRGKYLSVFVCLCRGEYDALLSWPFSLPITVKLLDQAIDPTMRKDHSVLIRPNPIPSNNAYLKRPTSERNQCFGSPRFIELEQMNAREFVVDNTLYLKALFEIET